jgi:single-strand DNA-binding protein
LQNGTQVPDRTEWHNIVLWRGLAQTAEKYVHKGDKLYIEGKIKSRSYDDQNGIKRTIVEIFADNMEMLTPRGASQPQMASPAPQAAQQQPMPADASEDLPF